jgi:hypothetical protein
MVDLIRRQQLEQAPREDTTEETQGRRAHGSGGRDATASQKLPRNARDHQQLEEVEGLFYNIFRGSSALRESEFLLF